MAVHLFAGDYYYPSGGLRDYVGPYDTEEEAVKAGRDLIKVNPNKPYSANDWFVVVEVRDGRLHETVREYRSNEHRSIHDS